MQFAFVLAFVLISETLALKLTDCGSKNGKIVDVRLTGCEDTDICTVKRGGTYTVGLTFDSHTDTKSLTARVYGIINGVQIEYPLPNSNVCETEDIECPLENGKTYNFDRTFDVHPNCPQMRVDVKWELKDDNNENVVCGIVPVIIE